MFYLGKKTPFVKRVRRAMCGLAKVKPSWNRKQLKEKLFVLRHSDWKVDSMVTLVTRFQKKEEIFCG